MIVLLPLGFLAALLVALWMPHRPGEHRGPIVAALVLLTVLATLAAALVLLVRLVRHLSGR